MAAVWLLVLLLLRTRPAAGTTGARPSAPQEAATRAAEPAEPGRRAADWAASAAEPTTGAAEPALASTEPACLAYRLRATKSSLSIGWLGRAATRAAAARWAVHNRTVCVPEALAEASVRGQCALPQKQAVYGCLRLPPGECRAAVCVPGFSVPAPFRRGQRTPGCVTRSHAAADVRHVMCASGCLLLTLDATPVAVPATWSLPRAATAACAAAWRAVLADERPGELWYDGLAARAAQSFSLRAHDGGAAQQRLFLLAREPEAGLPRGWRRGGSTG